MPSRTQSESDPWTDVFGPHWPEDAARNAGLASVRSGLFGTANAQRFGDRYRVLATRGAGGYGVVFEAEDLTLGRRVAIKVPTLPRGDRGPAEARFIREANALARVVHPNVVSIYDIGRDDRDEPFFAMELIEGVTLGAWCKAPGRTRAEILHAYLAAGRGLAAVHAAGLTHRDFKPHNVLVSIDGAVRLCDFGLAARSHLREHVATHSFDAAADWSDPLASTGTIAGTPRYMSPEQHRGDATGPASDQFAFCIALLEALGGDEPFGGGGYQTLVNAKETGTMSRAALERIDARLARVLRRGLDPRPVRRWSSMQALVAALSRAEASPRRRVYTAVAGVVLLAIVPLLHGGASVDCAALADAESSLGDARLESLRRTYASVGAEPTWRGAAPLVVGFRRQWGSAYAQVCHAEFDAAAASQQRQCLEDALVQAEATLDALAVPDEASVRNTLSALASIPSVDACASVQARPREAESRGHVVAELTAELPRVKALYAVGRFDAALTMAEASLAQARAAEYEPAIASIATLVAMLRLELGTEVASVAEDLQRAYFSARGAGDDHTAVRAAILLVHVYTSEISDPSEARRWGSTVDSLSDSLSDHAVPRDRLELSLLLSRARLALAGGEVDRAVELLRELDTASVALVGERSRERIPLRWSLGLALAWAEQLEAAASVLQSTLELADEVLEPDHPERARVRLELGDVRQRLGQPGAARSLYSDAAEILEAAGPLPRDEARLHLLLAILEAGDGELARAERHTRAALERYVALVGEDSGLVFQAVNNLGLILLDQGRVPEALSAFSRAESILQRTDDALDARWFGLRLNTAKAWAAAGRVSAARVEMRAVIDAARGRTAVPAASLAQGAHMLGALELDAGLYDEAVTSLQDSLSLTAHAGLPSHVAIEPLILLSRARLGQGDHCAARAEAGRAAVLLERMPERPRPLVDAVGDQMAALALHTGPDGDCG